MASFDRAGVWIAAAALLEAGTGVTLLVAPSLLSELLFGQGLTMPATALGRFAGFVLLALAVACWPRGRGAANLPAIRGLLLLNAAASIYLAYLGATGAADGILLWPAAATHLLLGAMLAWSWAGLRAAPQTQDR